MNTAARWLHNVAAVEVLAGSAFMTTLRLEWMRHFSIIDKPLVVQVRGDADSIVYLDDSLDVEGPANGTQLYMANANHGDIPSIEGVAEDLPGGRWRKLRLAILDETLTATPAPELSAEEKRYESVVFIMHGIRAGNDAWVGQLDHLLQQDGTVDTVMPPCGWLSAFGFAFPFRRRYRLRQFRDKYTYEFSRFPTLPLHFVGHSNGTYLCGRSVEAVDAMRFHRVTSPAASCRRRSIELFCATGASSPCW